MSRGGNSDLKIESPILLQIVDGISSLVVRDDQLSLDRTLPRDTIIITRVENGKSIPGYQARLINQGLALLVHDQ